MATLLTRLGAVVLVLLCGSPRLWAQTSRPGEYEVKAAYLFSLGRFVDWPVRAVPAATFAVCVLGGDPFGEELDQAGANLLVNELPTSVRRVATVEDASACHVLFIAEVDPGALDVLLVDLRTVGVLTVGESPAFAERGGMIQFVIEENRVRFIVNRAAADEAGLTLRSELLRVASRVVTTRRQG